MSDCPQLEQECKRVEKRTVSGRPLAELILLAASLLVCAWLDVRAVLLVVLVATSDHLIARRMLATPAGARRRLLLCVSALVDIGLLAGWKTAAAAIPALAVPGTGSIWNERMIGTAIPVGLSFFTLRSLAYVVDVHRGRVVAGTTWVRFASFLCFFPAFIAGPIARGADLLPQLRQRISVSRRSLWEGASIFIQGAAKKLLVADRLATISDPVFLRPDLYEPATVAAGIAAYALQVYCDFSGYCDMAVGAARVLSIDLPENFNMPYLASSLSEFWRRWHMTLSAWLRDYVFLPMAYLGSRQSERIGLNGRRGQLVNYAVCSVLTMLLTGLWHGVGWGFLIWGAVHGVGLAAQRTWQGARYRKRGLPTWVARIITIGFVTLAWVPFRAGSLDATVAVYLGLLGLGGHLTYRWFPSWLPICLTAVVLGHAATWLMTKEEPEPRSNVGARMKRTLGLERGAGHLCGTYLVPVRATFIGTYVVLLLVFSIVLFSPPRVGPFVYGGF